MIAVDTNVLVRLLVADDDDQVGRARALLTRVVAEGVQHAIEAYAAGGGGFADYLIGAAARSAGAEVVYTFDRALIDGVSYLEP